MIDLTINESVLESAAAVARDRSIRIPTFKQMQNPELIPDSIKSQLGGVGVLFLRHDRGAGTESIG